MWYCKYAIVYVDKSHIQGGERVQLFPSAAEKSAKHFRFYAVSYIIMCAIASIFCQDYEFCERFVNFGFCRILLLKCEANTVLLTGVLTTDTLSSLNEQHLMNSQTNFLAFLAIESYNVVLSR